MDQLKESALSDYTDIAVINQPHKVYLVQHKNTHKVYVKKMLTVYNRQVFDRLQSHPVPGIPELVECVEDEGVLTIIEEYISGRTLTEVISEDAPDIKAITGYMLQVCDILAALHSFSPPIIHRDLKPSNIMVDRLGRLYLLDFNAAKFHQPGSDRDTVLIGTHGYAAPEQYGFGSSTVQTDIYGLGMVLKELTAGSKEAAAAFEDIIKRCTMLSPDQRFRDITQLREALEAVLNPGRKARAVHALKRLLPPGYRSGTPWKMFFATFAYIYLAWCCASMTLANYPPQMRWFSRIMYFLILIFMILIVFNYCGVQTYLPLHHHPKRWVRILGIGLSMAGVMASFLVILLVLETILRAV